MGYVDEAFDKLRSSLEITQTEKNFAKSKHKQIRDNVSAKWEVIDDFLTGSYFRETKTKRLKDVDIFIVIDSGGEQAKLRDSGPSKVIEELKSVLEEHYDSVVSDGFACRVDFGAEDEVASFDVVPAFERKGGGYEIPDARRGRWIATNPKVHAEITTAKNKACEKAFIPFVKMIKGMNREDEEPIKPSFLLEVMAYDLVKEPFGRYPDEIRWFLASAADRVGNQWADPAGLGPAVNDTWSASDKANARAAISEWLAVAEEAIRLTDAGEERGAVEEWRKLFGSRMPRP
jgi:predicted nucleotidyltransferase